MEFDMYFFQNYPKVDYVTKDGSIMTVTDITRRFKFVETVLSNRYILFNYTIKENERPDIIADKYYGDSTLDWIILLTNKIIDPYFDWPLTNRQFEDYISKKYDSLSYAKTTYIKYYKIIQQKTITYDGYNVPEKVIEVDPTAYQMIPEESRRRVTIYQDEMLKNESNKQIKLIEKTYIPQILAEATKLYG